VLAYRGKLAQWGFFTYDFTVSDFGQLGLQIAIVLILLILRLHPSVDISLHNFFGGSSYDQPFEAGTN
jgi:hypothetical protein